ncbi:MAG: type II toxin-antitoxin system prevent-host-death family antitoxin [Acidobacteria bacterium]|nr:MAG: type II toxin-antitoxin system prevent-host-death family antitoxin [Acidobacteriota bacterium]
MRLIEKVYEGEEVIIARGGQPLVRLQPLREKTGQCKPGSMKGKLKVDPEFFEPLPQSELKAWE